MGPLYRAGRCLGGPPVQRRCRRSPRRASRQARRDPEDGARQQGSPQAPVRRHPLSGGPPRQAHVRHLPQAGPGGRHGQVEGAIKYVIAKRCDHGGMRWIRERAQAVIQLRCIDVNEQWDAFISWTLDRLRTTASELGRRIRLQTQEASSRSCASGTGAQTPMNTASRGSGRCSIRQVRS